MDIVRSIEGFEGMRKPLAVGAVVGADGDIVDEGASAALLMNLFEEAMITAGETVQIELCNQVRIIDS